MQLIVLTGLAVVEKQQLAQELASHFSAVIVDNLTALPSAAETMIFVAPAQISPDDLYALLDTLPPGCEVLTVAVIDTRTCDCFPNLRNTLEQNADVVVNVGDDESLLSAELLNRIASRETKSV
jgi:hypothetical protein